MPQATSKATSTAEEFDRQWREFHSRTFPSAFPPANAINAYDYAKLNDVKPAMAKAHLERRVAAGEMNTDVFRVQRGGIMRRVRYYWLAPRGRK